MANLQVALQKLLQRVTCLEECNRLKDEEILALQTDVDNLQKRSFASGTDALGSDSSINTTTSSKGTGDANTKHLSHSSDTSAVTNDPNRYKQMEERMTRVEKQMEDLTHRLVAVENVQKAMDSGVHISEKETDRFRGTKNVSQERTVDLQTQSTASKHVERQLQLELKIERLEEQIAAHVKQSTVLRHVMKQGDLEQKIKTLEDQITACKLYMDTIKGSQDIMEKTAFFAYLDPGTELTVEEYTRLDCCYKVHLSSGYFDKDTAWFATPIEGTYLFKVTLCQVGHGKLHVSVRTKRGEQPHIVTTYINANCPEDSGDTRTGSVLMRLPRCALVGVYVERAEGQASVSWCQFGGCLLSSAASSGASASR